MYKGTDIIGKSIITFDTGSKIDTVKDILFDGQQNIVFALLVDEGGLLSNARLIPFSRIRAIGPDAVTVDNTSAVMQAESDSKAKAMLDKHAVVKGTKVMTEDGRDLGKISDIYFNQETGELAGYEVSGGIFSDVYSGASFLPAPKTIRLGEDLAFVPNEVASMMEEQVGGLKADLQSAKEHVSQAAGTAKESAGEAINVTKEKVAAWSESVSDKAHEYAGKAGAHAEEFALEQTKGRRVAKAVPHPSGGIIAAPGQIVTDSVIAEAKASHQEQALIAAVAAGQAGEAKQHLAGAAHETGEKFTDTISSVWGNIKQKATEYSGKASDKIEQSKIDEALGRPVTRVILDKHDAVILQTGQIVTHQAITKATEAGVLDILLSSVSHDTPRFSSEELKSAKPNTPAHQH